MNSEKRKINNAYQARRLREKRKDERMFLINLYKYIETNLSEKDFQCIFDNLIYCINKKYKKNIIKENIISELKKFKDYI